VAQCVGEASVILIQRTQALNIGQPSLRLLRLIGSQVNEGIFGQTLGHGIRMSRCRGLHVLCDQYVVCRIGGTVERLGIGRYSSKTAMSAQRVIQGLGFAALLCLLLCLLVWEYACMCPSVQVNARNQ